MRLHSGISCSSLACARARARASRSRSLSLSKNPFFLVGRDTQEALWTTNQEEELAGRR